MQNSGKLTSQASKSYKSTFQFPTAFLSSALHLEVVISASIVVTFGIGLIATRSTPTSTLETGQYLLHTCNLEILLFEIHQIRCDVF